MNFRYFWGIVAALFLSVLITGFMFFSQLLHSPNPNSEGPSGSEEVATPINSEEMKKYADSVFGFEFEYPAALYEVTSEIYLPPENILYPANKLVSKNDFANFGEKECYYGLSGQVQMCEPKYASGISISTVNSAVSDLTFNLDKKEIDVSGKTVYYFGMGAEGEGQDFYFIPVSANKTLVMSLLYRMNNSEIKTELLDQILSTLKFRGVTASLSISEDQIINRIKNDWAAIEYKIPFRPEFKDSISTKWTGPDAVQFIGNSRVLIRISDDGSSHIGVLDFNTQVPEFIQFYKNRSELGLDERENIVKKYGDLYYQFTTYAKEIIRNNEVLSFSQLTEVPENVFLESYFSM